MGQATLQTNTLMGEVPVTNIMALYTFSLIREMSQLSRGRGRSEKHRRAGHAHGRWREATKNTSFYSNDAQTQR